MASRTRQQRPPNPVGLTGGTRERPFRGALSLWSVDQEGRSTIRRAIFADSNEPALSSFLAVAAVTA